MSRAAANPEVAELKLSKKKTLKCRGAEQMVNIMAKKFGRPINIVEEREFMQNDAAARWLRRSSGRKSQAKLHQKPACGRKLGGNSRKNS